MWVSKVHVSFDPKEVVLKTFDVTCNTWYWHSDPLINWESVPVCQIADCIAMHFLECPKDVRELPRWSPEWLFQQFRNVSRPVLCFVFRSISPVWNDVLTCLLIKYECSFCVIFIFRTEHIFTFKVYYMNINWIFFYTSQSLRPTLQY